MKKFTEKASVILIIALCAMIPLTALSAGRAKLNKRIVKAPAAGEWIAEIDYYGSYYADEGIDASDFELILVKGDVGLDEMTGEPTGAGELYYFEFMGQPGNPDFVGTYTVDFAFSYDPGTVIAGEPVNFPNYPSYYYDGTKVRYMMSGTMTISGTEGNYTIAIDMKDDESKDVKMTYTGDVYFYDESGDDEPVNPGTGGVVFLETFGDKAVTKTYGPNQNSWPYPDQFTDWSNPSCVFGGQNASVRNVNDVNNIWFVANKESFFSISGINVAGYSNLELSFDMACGNSKENTGNSSKMTVTCNDANITVPSVTLGAMNEFSNISGMSLPQADKLNLKFAFTAANNPTNYGYRLANIKITGETGGAEYKKVSSMLVTNENAKVLVSVNRDSDVQVYNMYGILVGQSNVSAGGTDTFSLPAGAVYIVKAGDQVTKVCL